MTTERLGLITGSGFYDLPDVVDRDVQLIETAYGSASVTFGSWGGTDVAFLARHGTDHSVPPHAINYRANIAAMKEAGATSILATAVSGGITAPMKTGALVIISDLINLTSGRADTFFDGSDGVVHHADMGHVFHPELRRRLIEAAAAEGIDVVDHGVYCAANGPRLETPAEITMMERMGGDLVGMTAYPEAALAVEAGLRYASVGVIANPAAGRGTEEITLEDVLAVVAGCADPLYRLIGRTITDWQPR